MHYPGKIRSTFDGMSFSGGLDHLALRSVWHWLAGLVAVQNLELVSKHQQDLQQAVSFHPRSVAQKFWRVFEKIIGLVSRKKASQPMMARYSLPSMSIFTS